MVLYQDFLPVIAKRLQHKETVDDLLVCMYACMHHECMYACMHSCMYVCMYVSVGETATTQRDCR